MLWMDDDDGDKLKQRSRRLYKRTSNGLYKRGRGMGKYTRKCSRGVEKLSVMEVVGVRRRARAQARVPAVAVAADAASARTSERRKTAPRRPTEVVETSSYLQLRSRRRLFMTFRRPRLLAANSAAYSTAPAMEGVSRCSSNVSGDVVVDEQVSRRDPKSVLRFQLFRLEFTSVLASSSSFLRFRRARV
ncbi:hypothetical protein BHM03_00014194 [Ensete ventricosum]|nr:hypothetical protein BHM03_00014194 [Ensete ventricosum]